MKSSELIGSSVLVLEKAEICGTVSNLIFSDKLKKVSHLEVFIDDEDDCEVKYISVRNVFATTKDVVTVKYPGSLSAVPPTGITCPINLPAYDECGKAIGTVTDVDLNGWTAVSLEAGHMTFSPAEILSRSDALIVIKKKGSTLKLTQKKKRVPKAKAIPPEERKVSIMSTPKISAPRLAVSPSEYTFLHGRNVTRNITALDGRLIITQGMTVTPELISIAKKSGVIAQLAQSITSTENGKTK